MEYYADRTAPEVLQMLGPLPALAVLIPVVCTSWLVISGVRDAFRYREPTPIRDIALLLSGPSCAVLSSLISITFYAKVALQYDTTDRQIVSAGLDEAYATSLVALICFLIGLIAILLPNRKRQNEDA